MPAARAVSLPLTASEHHRLKKMAYGHKIPHQAWQRAAAVLLAARGAPMPGNPRRRCCMWTRCRCAPGGAGWPPVACPALADRKRSGRWSAGPSSAPIAGGRRPPGRDRLLDRPAQGPLANDFTDLSEVRDRLWAFGDRHNAAAQPFQRRFTTSARMNCWLGSTSRLHLLTLPPRQGCAPAPVPRQPSGRGLALPGGGRVPGSSRVIASEMLGPSAGGYPMIPWELARA
jgi:hypothetical protein